MLNELFFSFLFSIVRSFEEFLNEQNNRQSEFKSTEEASVNSITSVYMRHAEKASENYPVEVADDVLPHNLTIASIFSPIKKDPNIVEDHETDDQEKGRRRSSDDSLSNFI